MGPDLAEVGTSLTLWVAIHSITVYIYFMLNSGESSRWERSDSVVQMTEKAQLSNLYASTRFSFLQQCLQPGSLIWPTWVSALPSRAA